MFRIFIKHHLNNLKKIKYKNYIKFFIIFICIFNHINNTNTYANFGDDDETIGVLGESNLSNHYYNLSNLYLTNYENISETGDPDSIAVRDKTYFSVAKSLHVEKKDLELMLIKNLSGKTKEKALQKFMSICSSNASVAERFRKCQKDLANRVQEEFNRQQFQEDMHEYALMSQAFANGTLQDTKGEFFDIIVDLNIIDLLLFGDKMNIPKTGSPFLRYDPFDDNASDSANIASENPNASASNSSSDNNVDSNSNSSAGNTENNTENNNGDQNNNNNDNSYNSDNMSDNMSDNTIIGYTDVNQEGFCVDPDGIVFENIKKHTVLGDTTGNKDIEFLTPHEVDNFTNPEDNSNSVNNTSVSASYGSVSDAVYPNDIQKIQLGNIVNPQIKYRGGVYPDISNISHKRKCKSDEDSFLNGRVCIKKICNEVLCITINLKTGISEKNKPLRKMDCVECHIDRGNEALSPFIGTLGQNRPNQHPMESNFLSAFGNLGKTLSKNIYLLPQRLPFLVYDENHPNKSKEELEEEQNIKQEENSEDKNKTEEKKEEEKSLEYKQNRALYNSLLVLSCAEQNTNFNAGEGDNSDIIEYCKKIDFENNQLENAQKRLNNKKNTQNQLRSDNYDKMLRPFLEQFTADMVVVNSYLQTINPANIKSKSKTCK